MRKRSKKLLYVGAAILLIVLVVIIVTQSNTLVGKQEKPKVANTVVTISKDMVTAEEKKAALFTQWTKKEKIPQDPTIPTPLEKAIQQAVAKNYADSQNITVSSDEITTQYKKAADSLGGEEKYLAKLKEIYGMEKDEVLEMISYDLLKQKISQKAGLPFDAWMKEEKEKITIQLPK